MMFQVVGLKEGKKYSVRMSGEKLTGDGFMLDLLRRENSVDHGLLGLPPALEPVGRYLSHECSANHLLQLCFDQIISSKNDWYDGVPSDAIF